MRRNKPLVSPEVIKASDDYFMKLDAIIQADPHLKRIFEETKRRAEKALRESHASSSKAQD